MTTALADPFASLKASEREHWASFAGAAIFSTVPAAKLVRFAQVSPGQRVLDVACGTGVVAVTAARRGAKVSGLDLSSDLLQRARENAVTAGVEVDFLEGDTEALPYPDATFNIVLSQFGHIFAPRPELAVREMLRVLKLGGRLVFSAWPPEHFGGRQFEFMARYAPPPAAGAEQPASPASWGDPNIIRQRLGGTVTNLFFERDIMVVAAAHPHCAGEGHRPSRQARGGVAHRPGQACKTAERIRGDDQRGVRRQRAAFALHHGACRQSAVNRSGCSPEETTGPARSGRPDERLREIWKVPSSRPVVPPAFRFAHAGYN